MMIAVATALLTSFVLPPARPPLTLTHQRASVAMELPFGIELPSFGGDDLQLIPSDVQFKDVDGDTITLRAVRNGKVSASAAALHSVSTFPSAERRLVAPAGRLTAPAVRLAAQVDYYVGKSLKLEGAVLVQNGNSLQVTGTIKKGTPLSFLGFNLEETQTDQMTPSDPEDVAKAMALLE